MHNNMYNNQLKIPIINKQKYYQENELTLSQTTNFRLFQTERVYR